MMKLFFKILLLIVALSTVGYSQISATRRAKSQRVFLELDFAALGFDKMQVILTKVRTVTGNSWRVVHTDEGEIASCDFEASLSSKTRNRAIIEVKIVATDDPAEVRQGKVLFLTNRQFLIRKGEVVEIIFKNGIKVKAYFENAKALIEKEKL